MENLIFFVLIIILILIIIYIVFNKNNNTNNVYNFNNDKKFDVELTISLSKTHKCIVKHIIKSGDTFVYHNTNNYTLDITTKTLNNEDDIYNFKETNYNGQGNIIFYLNESFKVIYNPQLTTTTTGSYTNISYTNTTSNNLVADSIFVIGGSPAKQSITIGPNTTSSVSLLVISYINSMYINKPIQYCISTVAGCDPATNTPPPFTLLPGYTNVELQIVTDSTYGYVINPIFSN